MNEPQINVDHFYHRPVYHVVGLLTDKSEIPAISSELESAGVDVAEVEILCGEHGALCRCLPLCLRRTLSITNDCAGMEILCLCDGDRFVCFIEAFL